MMKPGLMEYQVAAKMEEIHKWEGCSREAYAPIVGAGFFSTVLHYDALDNQIKDRGRGGDGRGRSVWRLRCGYHANGAGKWEIYGEAGEIYDIVLGTQNAAIAAVKPGVFMYGGPGGLRTIAADYINTHGKDKDRKWLENISCTGWGMALG